MGADESKPKAQPVRLTITSCNPIFTGYTKSRGDEYTIYEVEAVRENGELLTGKRLRSFENLPVGELLEVSVQPYNSEEHGVSFTLTRTSKPRSKTQEQIKALEDVVAGLARRVEALEGGTPPAAPAPSVDEQFGVTL